MKLYYKSRERWPRQNRSAFLHIKLLLKSIRMRAFMEQNDKQTFWRFTIRYNVILLGGLYLLLLVLTIIVMKFRMEGVIHAQLLLCLFLTLLVALVSWPVCVVKTWRRTKFDRKFRVLAMAYLFGVPIVLLFVTSAIMRLTTRLMMPWASLSKPNDSTPENNFGSLFAWDF